MAAKIIPIKADHALAESVVFFDLTKKAADYVRYFEGIDLSTLFDPTYTEERYKKKQFFEIALGDKENVVWKIVFANKFIGIECHDYSGWDNFIDVVCKIFSVFDTAILADIKSVCLFVKHEFDVVIEDEIEKDFDLSELFNKKSKFIVPVFFDTKTPPAVSTYKHQERVIRHQKKSYFLSNDINVMADEVEGRLKFFIAHRQRSSFLEVKGETNIEMECVKDFAGIMHAKNVEYVSNILEKKVLKSIGMA